MQESKSWKSIFVNAAGRIHTLWLIVELVSLIAALLGLRLSYPRPEVALLTVLTVVIVLLGITFAVLMDRFKERTWGMPAIVFGGFGVLVVLVWLLDDWTKALRPN